MFRNILLAFIPVFVAVDAIGLLPLFTSFTQDLEKKEKIKLIIQSVITAMCLAIGFLFLGKEIFKFLSITSGDFMIAGGILLFCLAIIDIVNPQDKRSIAGKDMGVVPLGTPLIAGPAVLTTSLIIVEEYGLYPTLISIMVNILLAGLIFLLSAFLLKLFGKSGSKALSKITSLLLAAIAVMMIRKGIMQVLSNW